MAHEPIRKKIYIMGPSLIENQIMAACLEKDLKVNCMCLSELTAEAFADTDPEILSVLLLNCIKHNTPEIDKWLAKIVPKPAGNLHIILFNVDPTCDLKKLLRNYRIRGVFYLRDSHQLFHKGMRAILKGEVWLSRNLLSECLLIFDKKGRADVKGATSLSRRETEVLRLVSIGFGNDETADKMHLSPHTVKTHLYNIYKKIGVANRLQASVWAHANLIELDY